MASSDRVLEYALRTFGKAPGSVPSAEQLQLVQRLQPVVEGARGGTRALIGCFGWLADLVTEWSGDAAQSLPITNPDSSAWSHGNATYGDLQQFLANLRRALDGVGLADVRLGALFVGWSQIYRIAQSPFRQRHPELYEPGGHGLSQRLMWHMAPDTYAYAAFPHGVPANTSFFAFWGAQVRLERERERERES